MPRPLEASEPVDRETGLSDDAAERSGLHVPGAVHRHRDRPAGIIRWGASHAPGLSPTNEDALSLALSGPSFALESARWHVEIAQERCGSPIPVSKRGPMAIEIEDELRERALLRIRLELGATRIDKAALESWLATTLEERAGAEIRRLKSSLAVPVDLPSMPAPGQVSVAAPKYKTAIVACARWETENILEWVTYHKSLGFGHIYLYCNDDDPTELYEKLCPLAVGDSPFVTFLHYPLVGLQTAMYKHFLRTANHEVEWLIFLDIDEFVALKRHSDIGGLIRDYEQTADAIYLNWVFFGNNGHVTRPSGSVLTQYVRRDRFVNPYTKVLTRVSSLDIGRIVEDGETGFWHDWNDGLAGSMRRVNVLHEDMAGYYDDFPDGARRYLDEGDRQQRILRTAAVYHFAFRSEQDIARRIERGVGGDFGGQLAFKKVLDQGDLKSFLDGFNQVEDTFLREYWASLMERSHGDRVIPKAPGTNIALGKKADQSSVCQWSSGATTEEDAASAVSGVISGRGAFHTDIEDCPWWSVDLGEPFRINEARLYNRMDNAEIKRRASRFRIQVSLDADLWQTVCSKTDEAPFGGIDGQPFIWRADTSIVARFFRIQLLTTQFLHLDQVEVYGEKWREGGLGA